MWNPIYCSVSIYKTCWHKTCLRYHTFLITSLVTSLVFILVVKLKKADLKYPSIKCVIIAHRKTWFCLDYISDTNILAFFRNLSAPMRSLKICLHIQILNSVSDKSFIPMWNLWFEEKSQWPLTIIWRIVLKRSSY